MDIHAQGSDAVPDLQFPFSVFKSKRRMDDYSASDMRYGDLSESQLKAIFHLVEVSTRVNPYTLTKITSFNRPQSMFYGMHGQGEKITKQQCVKILFDEFRHISHLFAVYGPYRHVIGKMIDHMQNGNGTPFCDSSLNRALKEQILHDKSENSSSRLLIEKVFNTNIDWENKCYPNKKKYLLSKAVLDSKLPKFNRLQDSVNGMGITVHDTWATHITIKSLHVDSDSYRAVVNYKVQDHFGLDDDDILSLKFSQFNFFRIWFLLQRYKSFGFKPFMTNMEASIEVTGRKDEVKK